MKFTVLDWQVSHHAFDRFKQRSGYANPRTPSSDSRVQKEMESELIKSAPFRVEGSKFYWKTDKWIFVIDHDEGTVLTAYLIDEEEDE